MDSYYIFDYTIFPPVFGNTITIPAKTLLYRSYDTKYQPISEYPCYFGSKEIASGYLKNATRKLSVFETSRSLNLLDLRYFKVLLERIISNREKNTLKVYDIIATCNLAYGLCSYDKQIELLNQRYKDNMEINPAIESMITFKSKMNNIKGFNPIEPRGVRIGETTNDALALAFIKELFSNVDGIISPKTFSPFHIEKNNYLSAEIVIFNPLKSCLKLLDQEPKNILNLSIESILPKKIHNYEYIVEREVLFKTKIIGGSGIIRDRNYFFDEILAGNKEYKKQYDQVSKLGSKFKYYSKNLQIDPIFLNQPLIDLGDCSY